MSVAGYIEEEDIEEACQGPCRHAEAELSELKDHLDLMVDEFKRIRGLTDNSEIQQLCDRAVSNTKQRIPVIEQRNAAYNELGHLRQELNNWIDTARQHCKNECYYRGLLVEIGALFGSVAYISDDGSVQDDVLCAKVPELIKGLFEFKKAVEANGRKPWEVYLNWPTDEEPFGAIPLTIVDTGHSEKILVVECEEVNRLRRKSEMENKEIYCVPAEDFTELLKQFPECVYITSFDTSVGLFDKDSKHIGSIAFSHFLPDKK